MPGVENQTTFSADGLDERIQAQQCLEGAQRSGDKAAALSSREQIMVAQEAVDKAESRERGVQNSLTDTSDFLMTQAAAKQARSTEPK